jgi:hypothetical protein
MTQAREIADLGSVLTVTAGAVTVGNSSIAGSISVANSAGTYGAGYYLVSNGSASAAATIDITLPSVFRRFRLVLGPGTYPSVDSAVLGMRVSYDGGSSFSATGYGWGQVFTSTQTASATGGFSSGDSSAWTSTGFALSSYVQDSGSSTAGSYIIEIENGSGSVVPSVFWRSHHLHGTNAYNCISMGSGNHNTADIYDAVRLLYNTGNITSPWALYGAPL